MSMGMRGERDEMEEIQSLEQIHKEKRAD